MKTQLWTLFAGQSRYALLVGLALGMGSGLAYAQEEDEGYGDPRPSEMMPLAPESLLLDMAHAGDNIVAIGERGHVLVSTDGGETFEQKPTPTRATLTSVSFVDADTGWAVGHDAVIIGTSDGGQTWEIQNWEPELESPLLDALFLDAQRGFAIGAYGLFKRTTDGGQTWEDVDNNITVNEWHLTSMTRLNDGALLIAGEAGGLALSRDEGETWVQLESPYEGSFFGAVPWGEQGAVIFGLRGNAFMTDKLPALDAVEDVVAVDPRSDSADAEMALPSAQWTRLDTGTVQSFMGGHAVPNGKLALVGVNGTVVVVQPGGGVKRLKNDTTEGFAAVLPQGDSKLLVSGQGGTHHYSY